MCYIACASVCADETIDFAELWNFQPADKIDDDDNKHATEFSTGKELSLVGKYRKS